MSSDCIVVKSDRLKGAIALKTTYDTYKAVSGYMGGAGSVSAKAGAAANVTGGSTVSAGSGPSLTPTTQISKAGTDDIIRTGGVNTHIPNSSLYSHPGDPNAHYLVETDPRFTHYKSWLSSDFLLSQMGYDPDATQKRLGDGFYEQKLIREQVAQLTGRRFLEGYADDEAEYIALMDNGATFAKAYGLVPGVALSAQMMAQLTSDMVWLVKQTITLADGSTTEALVPQVYVKLKQGDLNGDGTLISANVVSLAFKGDITNTGTIAGRDLVALNAENVKNLGGRIQGDAVSLKAKHDIDNIGGNITAKNTLIAQAGHDLNVTTTTRSATSEDGRFSRTTVDRVAGLYVTGTDDGQGGKNSGVLVASAGHDINLTAAVIQNGTPKLDRAQAHAETDTDTYTEAVRGPTPLVHSQPINTVSRNGVMSTSAAVSGNASASDHLPPGTYLSAGHDINLGTVSVAQTERFGSGANHDHLSTDSDVGSVIQSQGNIMFKAGNDLKARAANVVSEGSVTAVAGRDINISAGQAHSSIDFADKSSGGHFLSKSQDSRQYQTDKQTLVSSNFVAGDSLSMKAGRDFNASASNLSAINDTTLVAGRDLTLTTQSESQSTLHNEQHSQSGLSASVLTGINYQSSSLTQANTSRRTTQVGTQVSGHNVQLQAGRDATVTASNVIADNDLTVTAGRNIDILAATETTHEASHSSSHSSSFMLTPGLSLSQTIIGMNKNKDRGTGDSTKAVTSILSANGGSLTMTAGQDKQYTGAGEGHIHTEGANLQANNDLTLKGRSILLEDVHSDSASTYHSESQSASIGAHLSGLVGELYNNVKTFEHTDNDRLKGAIALKTTYDTYKAVSGYMGGAGSVSAKAGAASNATGGGGGGTLIGVSISSDYSTSRSDSRSTSSTARGTTLQGNHVSLTATDGDITAKGAKIQGADVDLWASQNINLLAATNQSETHSHNSGFSLGGGVTAGLGMQNGISFQASASLSKGHANGTETTYDNTQILASNNFNLHSGKDTNLQGAQINANHIDADIQGNLNIFTLQDKSNYESKQQDMGASLSVCIPPICWGQMVSVLSGSVSYNEQDINHNYQSAVGQSGFFAGAGGYDIHVKGNTHLSGGAIASAATDPTLNNLSTARLTFDDLENQQNTKVDSFGVSVSYGSALSLAQNVAGNAANNALGNAAGLLAVGHQGKEHSSTQSFITGNVTLTGTGDAALDAQSQSNASLLTTRDASTANGALTNTLALADVGKINAQLKAQQENAQAAQMVGSVITNAIGDYAAAHAQENPDLWKEGGLGKIALHGLAGMIEAKVAGGDLAAGLAAGVGNELLVGRMGEYLNTQGITQQSDPATYNALMKAGSELAGVAIGAVVSGGNVKTAAITGNIAQTATTYNYLSHDQSALKSKLQDERLRCHLSGGDCSGIQAQLNKIDAIDAASDAAINAACVGVNIGSAGCTAEVNKAKAAYASYGDTIYSGSMAEDLANFTGHGAISDIMGNAHPGPYKATGVTLAGAGVAAATVGGANLAVACLYNLWACTKVASGVVEAGAYTAAGVVNPTSEAPSFEAEAVPEAEATLQAEINAAQAAREEGAAKAAANAENSPDTLLPEASPAEREVVLPPDELVPPKITQNEEGMTEVHVTHTPVEGQRRLNTPDGGKLNPAEAAAGAQIEPVVGKMERLPTPRDASGNGIKAGDFKITEGPNEGKIVDMMYTTAGGTAKQVEGMNRNFARTFARSGIGGIQNHLAKADFVAMDFRILTPTNQKIVMDYIKTLPASQKLKFIIMR